MIEEYQKVSLEDIKWLKLNYSELIDFFQQNYFSKEDNLSEAPEGMHYLTFDNMGYDYSFLLGVISVKDRFLILSSMIFCENYIVLANQIEPLTYVVAVETNKYVQRRGIYKLLAEKAIDFLNPQQNVLISTESEMGKIVGTAHILRTALLKNGFSKFIWSDYSKIVDNPEFIAALTDQNQKLARKK